MQEMPPPLLPPQARPYGQQRLLRMGVLYISAALHGWGSYQPGTMAFTVTPSLPASRATDLVNPMTLPLQCSTPLPFGSRCPYTELILMTCP